DVVVKSDHDGKVRIDQSQRRFTDTLSVDVWAEGYIQQRFDYARDDARIPKIPGQVTIDLLPGEETLGGKVTDVQGRPIGGVKVVIWGYLGEKKRKEEGAWMVDAITDDQGQWRLRSSRGMTFAYLHLSHPNYLADGVRHPRMHGQPTPSQPPR